MSSSVHTILEVIPLRYRHCAHLGGKEGMLQPFLEQRDYRYINLDVHTTFAYVVGNAVAESGVVINDILSTNSMHIVEGSQAVTCVEGVIWRE